MSEIRSLVERYELALQQYHLTVLDALPSFDRALLSPVLSHAPDLAFRSRYGTSPSLPTAASDPALQLYTFHPYGLQHFLMWHLSNLGWRGKKPPRERVNRLLRGQVLESEQYVHVVEDFLIDVLYEGSRTAYREYQRRFSFTHQTFLPSGWLWKQLDEEDPSHEERPEAPPVRHLSHWPRLQPHGAAALPSAALSAPVQEALSLPGASSSELARRREQLREDHRQSQKRAQPDWPVRPLRLLEAHEPSWSPFESSVFEFDFLQGDSEYWRLQRERARAYYIAQGVLSAADFAEGGDYGPQRFVSRASIRVSHPERIAEYTHNAGIVREMLLRMSPEQASRLIGLKGPSGTGKTTLLNQ